MTPKHTFTFRAYQQDIDCTNRMSLSAIVRALLNAACMAADDNAFGTIQLNQKGLTWVLSRLSLKLDRLPQSESNFNVTTWIESCNNIVSTRNFLMTDENGVELGSACSMWSIIDVQTRQPINLMTQNYLVEAIQGDKIDCARPRHIPMTNEPDSCWEHRVVYSDLDFNHHVNSTRYVDWMMNALPISVVENNEIMGCTINYSAESYYGENVIVVQKTEESSSYCGIKRNEKPVCTMKIDWKITK